MPKDPRTHHPTVDPEKQTQPEPVLDVELSPQADVGLDSYTDNDGVADCNALITGGDYGIGAAVAIAYAREGADVAIAYLPEEQPDADRVIQAIEDAGQKAFAYPGDLKDADYCRTLVEKTVEALGGLDIL